jgi:hypothetical protein
MNKSEDGEAEAKSHALVLYLLLRRALLGFMRRFVDCEDEMLRFKAEDT